MGHRKVLALCAATAFGLASITGEARAQAPAPAPAQAGELPVAVLTVGTLDAFEQADALTGALKSAVEDADGFSRKDFEKDPALLFLTSSLGCNDPPDAACEQKIADELKVDRFVWGTMRKEGNEVVGDLHFWQRGQASKGITYKFPINVVVSGDKDFVHLVADKLAELIGPPPASKLTIKAGAVNGQVLVDGAPVGKIVGGTATIDISKGTHKIVVRADGYEDMETTVDLKARETREISLLPMKKGSGPDIQKILGFTAMGLGVVAAGVATYAGIRVLGINSDLAEYREGTNPNWRFDPPGADGEDLDGCDPEGNYQHLRELPTGNHDAAERADIIDKCQEGKTMQTLTLAMWPVAGALAGAGVILVATANWSSSKEAASLPFIVLPNFGPHGGDVTFSGRF